MGHHVEADLGGVERRHAHHAHLAEVGDGAEAVLLPFVDHRGHDFRVHGAKLEAVDLRAVHLDPNGPLHPFPRFLGGIDGAAVPGLAGAGVGEHARRDDLVALGRRLLAERPHHRAVADAARGGDAVPHPELVDVFGLGRLPRSPGVGVHVDEAGHDVHAAQVDLLRRAGGAAVLVDRYAGIPDGLDLNDAIALDHDIHGSHGRGAGPVDDRGAAQDKPLVGAVALVGAAGGGGLHLRRERGGNRGGAEEHHGEHAKQDARGLHPGTS